MFMPIVICNKKVMMLDALRTVYGCHLRLLIVDIAVHIVLHLRGGVFTTPGAGDESVDTLAVCTQIVQRLERFGRLETTDAKSVRTCF